MDKTPAELIAECVRAIAMDAVEAANINAFARQSLLANWTRRIEQHMRPIQQRLERAEQELALLRDYYEADRKIITADALEYGQNRIRRRDEGVDEKWVAQRKLGTLRQSRGEGGRDELR